MSDFPSDFLPLLEQLCEIGAPTGQEQRRAAFIRDWLNAVRPDAARIDEDDNVLVDLAAGRPAWLLDAHTDIVFPDERLSVRKEGAKWHCPGIYDNTVACVFLMQLARQFLATNSPAPFLISFTSGEEGSGNLRGMRGLMARQSERIRGAFAFDLRVDTVTTAAVGSERLNTRWTAAGGHSWKDFGQSSAIEMAAEWITSLRTMQPWENGRISYNLGEIRGGTGINVIAATAEVSFEIRSADAALLKPAASEARRVAEEIAQLRNGTVSFELIGSRPAAIVPPDWKGMDVLREVHDELALGWNDQVNSTNANAILAVGVPATCTGLVRGENIHTREEWLETETLPLGWAKLQGLIHRLPEIAKQ